MELLVKSKDPVLVNTVRRLVYESVPHFGFSPDAIIIKKNTTCLHNDQLRERISNMPVRGLRNDETTFRRFWDEQGELMVIRGGGSSLETNPGYEEDEIQTAELKPLTVDSLTLYVKTEHRDAQVQFVSVTTADCEFTINGRKVPNPYEKHDILLCKLRLGEEIELSAQTEMGFPMTHPRYNSVDNCYFREEQKGYRLFLEPRPGIKGEEIIRRACFILQRKMDTIQMIARDQSTGKKSSGEIKITNDRFTLPGIVTHYLMAHPAVSYAGFKCDHMLGRTSTISYCASADILKILENISKRVKEDTNSLFF